MRLIETCYHYIPDVSVLKALVPAPKEAEAYEVTPRWEKGAVSFVFRFPVVEGKSERKPVVVSATPNIGEIKVLELATTFMPDASVETIALASTALRVLCARINNT
jgi:hypothetical protein